MLLLLSCYVVLDSLQPHRLQDTEGSVFVDILNLALWK